MGTVSWVLDYGRYCELGFLGTIFFFFFFAYDIQWMAMGRCTVGLKIFFCVDDGSGKMWVSVLTRVSLWLLVEMQ